MLKLVEEYVDTEEGIVEQTYECDVKITLAGDSLYGTNKGDVATVTSVYTHKAQDSEYIALQVAHDLGWQVYTDTGFAKGISELMGYDVDFTEQGMQEDNNASMEIF